MNQHSATLGKPAARAPVFFWVTVSLLALLLLGSAVGAVFLAFEAKHIDGAGGWGWILVIVIYLAAIVGVCFGCVICTVVSLVRRERYRPLSIVILILSGLVVLTFGVTFIRSAIGRRLWNEKVAHRSANTPQPPVLAPSISPTPPSADPDSNAPVRRKVENREALELKSRLWDAIRANDADAFVDCYFVEARFNTPEIRQENRNHVEVLLRGKTVDLELLEIPDKELVEIMKIQDAKPSGLVRYSLMPRMMVRIRQEIPNGHAGRSFLIGERNGRWYIVTLAGRTT